MVKKMVKKAIKWVVDKYIGSELAQDANQVVSADYYKTEGLPQLIREAGAEGVVLLKNDGVLPLANGVKLAVFGRCQFNYLHVGYGSGGDIHAPYLTSLYKALIKANCNDGERQAEISLNNDVVTEYLAWSQTKASEIEPGFWGHWPMHYPEMPIGDLAERAAKNSDVAIVVIGRTAGEDRENVLEKGSYYLTDTEKDMLDKVTRAFQKTVVVLDCGNVIDLKELVAYKPSAILYAWMGGMEAGSAVLDVLLGKVNPSGKLSATIAIDYEDYPSSVNFGNAEYNNYTEDIFVGYRYFETFKKDRVLYPFGHGLSYTTFEKTSTARRTDSGIEMTVKVKNTGKTAGKEVVSVYVEKPRGVLTQPSRCLVQFAKTAVLAPQDEETITLAIPYYDYASYDPSTASYVLEGGRYSFFVGGSVRDAELCYQYDQDTSMVLAQHTNLFKVQEPFDVMVNNNGEMGYERVHVSDYNLAERILSTLPQGRVKTKEKYTYTDVKAGKVDVESFVASLSLEQLEGLTRGIGYMSSELGVKGNAGSFGGTTKSLRDKGVPPIITTDGPAGIRVSYYSSLLPCGTALASTFNMPLIERLYNKLGEEMLHFKTDFLLAPGLNIHRNPLCGRNFEYFSEDPYLAGKSASAVVRGVQAMGVGACPKHFACNNQEEKRFVNDSRVSERALREIYLKPFEIVVKESSPLSLMTSYNKINGVYSYYNYELATTLLRDEWGHQGMVMTDWWMRRGVSPDFPLVYDNAYRVRAGVDVLMPGNFSKVARKYKKDPSLLKNVDKKGGITRAEMERTAVRVINTALKLGK